MNAGPYPRRALLVALVALVAFPAAAQAVPATIQGTVTQEGGGPVQGICVEVDSSQVVVGGAVTAADGTYSADMDTSQSPVHVEFIDCRPGGMLVREYWNNKPTAGDADVLALAPGPNAGIDAALTPGGVISGKVARAVDGSGIEDACTQAIGPNGVGAVGQTDAAGDYSLVVPPATYDVLIERCGADGNWPSASASGKVVTAGNTTTVNFSLTEDFTGPIVTFIAPTPTEGAFTGDPVTINWQANELATYECVLNGTLARPCEPPQNLFPEPPGTHSFAVTGKDEFHNAGVTVTRTWTVPTPPLPPPPAAPPPPPAAAPAAARCTVPRLVGKTLARAKKLLVRARCRVGRVTRKAKRGKRRNTVLAQSPAAGRKRPASTKVRLTVAR